MNYDISPARSFLWDSWIKPPSTSWTYIKVGANMGKLYCFTLYYSHIWNLLRAFWRWFHNPKPPFGCSRRIPVGYLPALLPAASPSLWWFACSACHHHCVDQQRYANPLSTGDLPTLKAARELPKAVWSPTVFGGWLPYLVGGFDPKKTMKDFPTSTSGQLMIKKTVRISK